MVVVACLPLLFLYSQHRKPNFQEVEKKLCLLDDEMIVDDDCRLGLCACSSSHPSPGSSILLQGHIFGAFPYSLGNVGNVSLEFFGPTSQVFAVHDPDRRVA
jgi:hypothetical protein